MRNASLALGVDVRHWFRRAWVVALVVPLIASCGTDGADTASTDSTLAVVADEAVEPSSRQPGSGAGQTLVSPSPQPSPAAAVIDEATTIAATTTVAAASSTAPAAPASTTIAPAVTTTAPAPTTAASTTAAVAGVPIAVGESWQAKVNANPAGTTFVVRAGVHAGQSVSPKDGNTFVAEPGAVMDGQGSATVAISGSASGVTIRGLEIRNYRTPLQRGAVETGSRWLLESLNIHSNVGGGVALLGSDSVMRGGRVHHNGQIGLKSWNSTGAIFDGVEVDNNNTNNHDAGWEAGGSKFSETTNLTVRNSYVHHNNGPGLWTDYNNYGTLYESNRVENNSGAGIFHEISYNATIRNNTIIGNGTGSRHWLWGAGIQIAASGQVEIYANILSSNGNGIGLVQQNRGSGNRGPFLVQNVSVHDNTIISSGTTGGAQDISDNAIFTSRNNRFQNNTYRGQNGWTWNNSAIPRGLTFDGWQRHGQDTAGSSSTG